MNRKIGISLFSVVILMLAVLFGHEYYKSRIANTQSVAAKQYANDQRETKEKAKKEKAKKKAEAKRIYENHKGDKLIYEPMGDSLAVGSFSSSRNKRYVSLLADTIHKKMGYDVKILDSTLKSGTGLKDNGLPNVEHVIANHPDLITIEFGTNDSYIKLKNAYSRPDEFKKRLSSLVQKLKRGDKKVKIVLITTWNSGQRSIQYDEIIEDVGKEEHIPVANIESVWLNRTDTKNKKGKHTPYGISDDFHPNDEGHKEIAQLVYKQAYDLLK